MTDNPILSNRGFLNKYHEDEPYSFGGVNQIKNYFNVRPKKIKKVLSKSEIYTTFRQFKRPRKTPPIKTYGPNHLWEADLMFFTHSDFANSNDGYCYILAFIDTFTKLVGITKLRSKDTKTVTQRMRAKFESGDKP